MQHFIFYSHCVLDLSDMLVLNGLFVTTQTNSHVLLFLKGKISSHSKKICVLATIKYFLSSLIKHLHSSSIPENDIWRTIWAESVILASDSPRSEKGFAQAGSPHTASYAKPGSSVLHWAPISSLEGAKLQWPIGPSCCQTTDKNLQGQEGLQADM